MAQNCVDATSQGCHDGVHLIVRVAERELTEESDRAMVAGAAFAGDGAATLARWLHHLRFGQVAAVTAAQDTASEDP